MQYSTWYTLGKGHEQMYMHLMAKIKSFSQVNYLIDEAINTGKGANSIISMLHHFFEHHSLGESDINLHADNCSGQNKNQSYWPYVICEDISLLVVKNNCTLSTFV